FFQAEDGIRDSSVTGVQTCALPISSLADDAVLLTLAIWIGFASDAWVLGMRLANGVALDGVAGDLFGVSGGDIGEDVIVDGNCRSMIAAAETGDVANLYIFWPRIGKAAQEISAQLASAVEMAAHSSAEPNLRFG